MKNKKLLTGIFIFLAIVMLAGVGVNFWIKYELPKMLAEKNKSPYAITYKSLDYSLVAGYIKANEIIIVPKIAAKSDSVKSGIYATVKAVEVRNFKIWSILFGDQIRARSITVIQPEIILYKNNEKAVDPKNIRETVVAPFEKVIAVSDIYLYNGDAKIIYTKTNKAQLNAANINVQLEGIQVDERTLKQKIPFAFEKYSVKCDSFYYRPNAFYHFTTKQIAATTNDLKISHFNMTPEYSRREFVRKIKREKDLYVISAENIDVKNLDWGFESDVLFCNASSLVLDRVSADIYRNKTPEDDLTKKHLYNKLLRDLDFNLKIDTLKIRNSLLAYEEEKSFSGSGKLVFSKFNLTARNICSGFGKKKLPNLDIAIDCKFMDASPMHVDWTLNILDKSDSFRIKGKILDVPSQNVNAFTKPYINATTEGTLQEVYFDFRGNDRNSHGTFGLKYDDFKLVVYQKKEPKKKNKFLTAIGNLFVKNDSKDRVKHAEVEVERIPEKSFFNFFWRNIAEGLLKIFI